MLNILIFLPFGEQWGIPWGSWRLGWTKNLEVLFAWPIRIWILIRTLMWSRDSFSDRVQFCELVAATLKAYMSPATSTIPAAGAAPPPSDAAAPPPPPAAAAAESTATAAAVIDRERDSFGQLSSCWLRLLRSGQQADLQLICREEKVLPCHRLVIGLRCPPLLAQAVQERSAHGRTSLLVLRIRDILIRIRVNESVPLTNGSVSRSGSCYFRHWSRDANTKLFFSKFFCKLRFGGTFCIVFQR
jgi:hypothetical protein